MQKKILCTLGPSSFDKKIIQRLEGLGVGLFRINLSHTRFEDLEELIKHIQGITNVPLCIDTEGAQIRTGKIVDKEVRLRESTTVKIHHAAVPGDPYNLNFYPRDIISEFEIGDFISIDFHAVLAQVTHKNSDFVSLRVLSGGVVGQNKAVTVERFISMPPMTLKDRQCLELSRDLGINHFALSFAQNEKDILQVREIVGAKAHIIAKVECRAALNHLRPIINAADAILIDRGDLSREIPLERISLAQKHIIKECKSLEKKVFVATNLLESMITTPFPTRAEVNDIFNTLEDGADGLVLAAETAIGKYPVLATSMVSKLIIEHERKDNLSGENLFQTAALSLLIPPHGGRLIKQVATESELSDVSRCHQLAVSQEALMDCEQMALGTYSPLQGFMDRETLESVLYKNALTNGHLWTLPVILQIAAERLNRISVGDRVVLTDHHGIPHFFLDIEDLYQIDLSRISKEWFGTTHLSHPGVAKLFQRGEWVLAGKVTLIKKLDSPYKEYQLDPHQTRFIFQQKNWEKVVGFHSRNVIHRVHEHIQIKALEIANADGLFLSPVIGPKKSGDFAATPIIKSYQLMIDYNLYPQGKVVFGTFATYSRYSGPREAVFTALCRKNMGCSHFIIGRDHTGVGDFYAPDANRNFIESLDDLGITTLFFESIGYNPKENNYLPLENNNDCIAISGTSARSSLLKQTPLPDWYMRSFIQEMLFDEMKTGREIFIP